jgi:peptide/nickel transport system substrate-binding protein
MRRTLIAAALSAAMLLPGLGFAKTFKWTSQGDILTLDPHSQNEGLNIAANLWVYDPLVRYNEKYEIVPSLATSWERLNPTTMRFKLRPNVKFQDGTPFTADDVVFSLKRAMAPSSQFKSYVAGISDVVAVDPLTVDVITAGPNPVLLRQLPSLGIMSKAWSEKNNVALPQDFNKKEESFAARNAMGTGPYQLKSREVDIKTVYVENPNWWGKPTKTGNVTEIVYTPIKQNATRTAALLSGEVDFVLDPPAQDLDRLRKQVNVSDGNENRTIYIAMDVKNPELKYSNIKGKNPLADVRVREALYRAIDIEAIKKSVMRGMSLPTGAMISPQVNGYSDALGKRVPYDPVKARELLKQAGYDNNLEFTIDCPNNRYINDEAICQAVVAMWAKIGVKTKLNAMPRATFFPKVANGDTSIYLFGWGVPTFDAYYTLESLIRSKGTGAAGAFNYGGYSNPKVDALIDTIKTETDDAKRTAMIQEALSIHAKEFGTIPLHDQIIPWAMKKNVKVTHRPDNRPVIEWVRID